MVGRYFAAFLLAATVPAAAEIDDALMDVNQGAWVLSAADGQSCNVTLGDEPVSNGRVLTIMDDCAEVDGAAARAVAWQIDTDAYLYLVDGSGQPLLKFERWPDLSYRTPAEHQPALALVPGE